MKQQRTINKINNILSTIDYRGIPRGTIVNVCDDDEIRYLIRHQIICWAGDRLVMAY